MKIADVEKLDRLVKEIKDIGDKLDYNTSTAINQKIIQITPILNEESNRLKAQGVEINFPKILIFTNLDAKKDKLTVQDYMNSKLKELVVNEFKIIDYGKLDEEYADDNTRIIYMYIKYTD